MLGRKKISASYDTVIGKNTSFDGNIECNGSLRVDGRVIGDIKADGDILIGKEGAVKGNVEAVSVLLSGTVEGNIKALEILKIMSTTKLYGDVEVKSFVADEGAIFQGNCKMLDLDEDKLNDKPEKTKSKSRKSSSKPEKEEDGDKDTE